MKNEEFRFSLIEVRKAKGLTQEEVAKLCKVTSRTIQRIESGAVTPRPYTIKIICDALGFEYFNSSSQYKNEVPKQLRQNNIVMNKTVVIITLFVITGVILAFLYPEETHSKPIENSLIGKWRLCITDGTAWEDLFERKGYYRYKIISNETFMVVDTDSLTKNFYSYFIGNYSANNGEYSEKIQYTDSCFAMMADVTNTFKYRIKGDSLYLEGTNNCYNEIWKKVE